MRVQGGITQIRFSTGAAKFPWCFIFLGPPYFFLVLADIAGQFRVLRLLRPLSAVILHVLILQFKNPSANSSYYRYIVIRQDIEMTTVMNQKLARAYLKALQDKLLKKVKGLTKKITTEDVVEFIFEILPARANTNLHLRDALHVIQVNQDAIVDNRCEIQYLKRKAQLEDELTASFIKAIIKDRNKVNGSEQMLRTALKRQNSSMLNLPNVPSLSRYDNSRIEVRESRLDSSFDRSPIGSISRKQEDDSQRYGVCNTSRSKATGKYLHSQFSEELEPEQREKIKALSKLRKLEKYVFEKQNIHKDKSVKKIWNCGVSPTKLRYKQQNQNLKVIQSNLVTHLSLLQKYREIPSIEGLVARQEALKKKERQLRELGEVLSNKEVALNKKHSDLLKKQKSQKVL